MAHESDYLAIFETLAKACKGLTHIWISPKTGQGYLKEGPKSSGRKGKTIAWTGWPRKKK